MKRLLFLVPLLFVLAVSYGQQIKYAAPVPHTDGTPTGTPNSYSSFLRFDKTNKVLYKWGGSSWSSVSGSSASYTAYTALLYQTGADAPTVTVLENTLGATITWAYESAGTYTATASSGVFTSSSYCVCENVGDSTPENSAQGLCKRISSTVFRLYLSYQGSLADGFTTSSMPAMFEIRVYP